MTYASLHGMVSPSYSPHIATGQLSHSTLYNLQGIIAYSHSLMYFAQIKKILNVVPLVYILVFMS